MKSQGFQQNELPSSCELCIVGAGAAGLAAACYAARRGLRVVVLERGALAGKSILATGAGRCNLSSTQLFAPSPALFKAQYRHPQFVAQSFGKQALFEILDFFSSIGLAMSSEEDRIYPASFSATSVRDLLLAELKRVDAALFCNCEVLSITPNSSHKSPGKQGVFPDCSHETDALCEDQAPVYAQDSNASRGFELLCCFDKADTAPTKLLCQQVILAAGQKTPALARDLGLAEIPQTDVLCPLICLAGKTPRALAEPEQLLKLLNGCRVRAELNLYKNNILIHKEQGELLFRDWGLSGIVVLNCSRYLVSDQAKDEELGHFEVSLDLLPQLTSKENKEKNILDTEVAGSSSHKVKQESDFLAQQLVTQQKRSLELLARTRDAAEARRILSGLFEPKIAQALVASFLPQELSSRIRDLRFSVCAAQTAADYLRQHKAKPYSEQKIASICKGQVQSGGISLCELDPKTLAVKKQAGLYCAGEAVDVDAACGGFNLSWAWISAFRAAQAAVDQVKKAPDLPYMKASDTAQTAAGTAHRALTAAQKRSGTAHKAQLGSPDVARRAKTPAGARKAKSKAHNKSLRKR